MMAAENHMCDDCKTEGPKIDRRRLFGLGAAGLATALIAPGAARASCAPFTEAMQGDMTPDQALAELVAGNQRFVEGTSLVCDERVNLSATAEGQTPFACVLGCIDSRAAPEFVFDQQIGDIFVARVAGNVATSEVLGSFEYATKVAGAKLILVLGHSHCGAVKGAIDKAVVGDQLTHLLDEIEPAVTAVGEHGERSSKNHELVEMVVEENVKLAVAALTEKSSLIRDLVASGAVKVAGGLFDLDTGKVTILET
jgi:carbonic anhydrase